MVGQIYRALLREKATFHARGAENETPFTYSPVSLMIRCGCLPVTGKQDKALTSRR